MTWAGAVRVPSTFNFAVDVLDRRACDMPQGVALVSVDAAGAVSRFTYAEMAAATCRLAGSLARAGLKPGERVLVLLPRVAQWQVVLCACLRLGLVPVPLVSQISAADVAYRARISGARAVVTSVEHAQKFVAVRDALTLRLCLGSMPGWDSLDAAIAAPGDAPAVSLSADAPALMYFTSGSSGDPKAVLHATRGVFVRGWQPWHQLGVKPGDVIWATSDTGWTRAASCLLFGAWMHGATAFMQEGPPDPAQRLELLARHGITIFCAVATELRMLMGGDRKPPDLSRLRLTISAGEAVTAELVERWRAFSGAPILVGYGQTETPTATLTSPDVLPVNGMIGPPMPGNQVVVIGADGRELAVDEHGELAFAVDDPGLMMGYWQDGAIVPGPTRPGCAGDWYLTGDRGYRDADGNLFFVGREDDIISSAGYRIGPTEVENALMQHPAVAECAVAASPDALRGEVVKAFVVLNPGMRGSKQLAVALQEHVRACTAPYKYPRKLDFVASLPRTASGKITRRLLREAEFARRAENANVNPGETL